MFDLGSLLFNPFSSTLIHWDATTWQTSIYLIRPRWEWVYKYP